MAPAAYGQWRARRRRCAGCTAEWGLDAGAARRDGLHRNQPGALARWTLAGLRLERVGNQRGLCPPVSQFSRWPLADLEWRRIPAGMVLQGDRDFFPRSLVPAECGRGADR